MKQKTTRFGLLLTLAALLSGAAHAEVTYPPVDVLLQTEATIIGEQVIYPEGPAQITVAIVTMQPGQSTGWHRHEVPLTAHLLEGELTVDYGDKGTRVYKAGDTLVEALGSSHNGQNTGAGIVRILAVFAGAVGVPNTVSQ
jgi:quercetin dioxygenase-like cupin family protein